MDYSPSVSVVIPVFNVASYLTRCLDSVLGQTLLDIEVVCVDDGSTDGSRDILERRALEDKRLRIISLSENRGASAARNEGFSKTVGEFVYYMDSDDWIDSGYLESMLKPAREKSLDIVVNTCVDNVFQNQGSRNGFIPKSIRVKPGMYSPEFVANKFNSVVWTRLYRRSFLEENGLSFPESLSASEDYYYSRLAGMVNGPVWMFTGPAYHHLKRDNTLSTRNRFDNIRACKMLLDDMRARGLSFEGIKLFYMGRLVIDSEEKFTFAKRFLEEIAPIVEKHEELYKPGDLFCLKTLLSCEGWEDYKKRYNPDMMVNYILRHVKRG